MTEYPERDSAKGNIMTDKNTPEQEPVKDTPEPDSYEKRYKDLQSQTTKVTQELAAVREQADKDRDLMTTIQPYIDWDAVNGKTVVPEDDDALVDKKTLNATISDLKNQIQTNRTTQDFRTKYPDMTDYEDLVGTFLGKTDQRRPISERLEKAVENTRTLLESERKKGVESFKTKKKDKDAGEAEVAGLSSASVPVSKKDDADGESYEDYIKGRQQLSAQAQGLI